MVDHECDVVVELGWLMRWQSHAGGASLGLSHLRVGRLGIGSFLAFLLLSGLTFSSLLWLKDRLGLLCSITMCSQLLLRSEEVLLIVWSDWHRELLVES